MSANRLLFSALVAIVVATTALLWVAGADPQAMPLIAVSWLLPPAWRFYSGWTVGPRPATLTTPTATCISGTETGASDRG
jgi:hypothetical protein